MEKPPKPTGNTEIRLKMEAIFQIGKSRKISDDFRSFPMENVGSSSEVTEKLPQFPHPEYYFHVPSDSGGFLPEPARTA